MLTILHFADAHIDVAAHGRHDANTNLPVRVLDFLKALDTIVETAIEERVDLVLFAGDAYKDRSPAPTYQREWGRRIMRLSQAGIRTLLLVGNHDLSPAAGRAHALQEFDTLKVPHVRVLGQPCFLGPDDLEGLPLQVLALPWVTRSGLMAAMQLSAEKPDEVYQEIEKRFSQLVEKWLENADPNLPVILTAHASVQGAVYGGERSVMLGGDVVLPGSLVKDPRLDYVALGHIHKAQDLNEHSHPPVVYPGSIERVDFGEAGDEKSFVIAQVKKGKTSYKRRPLQGRKFIDRSLVLKSNVDVMEQILTALPPQPELEDAILRLVIDYPRSLDAFIDEPALRQYASAACEFHLLRRPQIESRLRLPGNATISSLSHIELLGLYWKTLNMEPETSQEMQQLADGILHAADEPLPPPTIRID